MTKSQREMCGCTFCIDGNGIIMALKGFRNMKLKNMNTKLGLMVQGTPHYAAFVKTIEQYKTEAFVVVHSTDPEIPDDYVPRWSTSQEAMWDMTCPGPTGGFFKDSGITHLTCALGHCEECGGSTLPLWLRELATYGQYLDEKDYIIWKQYEARYFCQQHAVCGKMAVCPSCTAHPDEKPEKDPARKMHYCRKRAPIGDLVGLYSSWLNNYRYHLFLVIVLGKNWCLKFRLETFFLIGGSVLITRDYADRMAVEMNNSAQSWE